MKTDPCLPFATGYDKPNAGADRTTCLGSAAVTLLGTSPATGTWTEQTGNPAGVTLSGSANGIATAQFTGTGVYNFIYTTGFTDTMKVAVNTCTTAPGGVMTNLALWLKANTAATADGNGSVLWTDQSNNFIATPDYNATVLPVYNAGTVNYNPSVAYTDDAMHIFPAAVMPTLGNSSLFVAGIPSDAAQSNGSNCSWTTRATGPSGLNLENPLYKDIASGNIGHYGAGVHNTTLDWAKWLGIILQSITFNDASVAIAKQGGTQQTKSNAVVPATISDNGRYSMLGNYAGGGYGFGNIAETIIYDNASLSAVNVQKIESIWPSNMV